MRGEILEISNENDSPYSDSIKDVRVVGQDVVGKLIAYRERFRNVSHEGKIGQDIYLLSDDICERELERAERQLLFEGVRVGEAKMVPFDSGHSCSGFEIDANGRRFSIPRDSYLDFRGREIMNVETAVVSVLDESKWPRSHRYDMTPEIEAALDDIANGPLVNDARDLAIYLKLGDRVPFLKNNMLQRKLFSKTLEKFGLDDIDDVKKILKSIGLKIIDTSDRLSEVVSIESIPGRDKSEIERVDSLSKIGLKTIFIASRNFGEKQAYGANARTEVDALVEAIHKTM